MMNEELYKQVQVREKEERRMQERRGERIGWYNQEMKYPREFDPLRSLLRWKYFPHLALSLLIIALILRLFA